MLRRAAIPALLIATLFALPARGWSPETRIAMADETLRLMPPGLREALSNERRAFLRGLLSPMARDGADRRPPWSGGHLERALAESASGLSGALARPTPFPELARRFGEVAHFVFETGFPPGMTRTDGASRYAHFAKFCESRRFKFPLVFYGHADPTLLRDDYRAFALASMARAGEDDRELSRTYAAAGDPPRASAFDDRSVPFAVASLAYSRTINDLARLWLHLWSAAGGDMEHTPFRGEGKP